MVAESLYKEVLLDHFHHPRNKGNPAGADVARWGSNPRIGYEIEVGIEVESGRLSRVRFRGRDCSVCIGSASLMTEAVTGRDAADALVLAEKMRGWFNGSEAHAAEPAAGLGTLSTVRAYPARRRCVLMAWEATPSKHSDVPTEQRTNARRHWFWCRSACRAS